MSIASGKLSVFAAILLGLANTCQSANAAEGYEISGLLRNVPAGTVLHLAELATSNQFVELGTAQTDAAGRFRFLGTLPAAVYQLKLDEPNAVLLVLRVYPKN